MAAETDAVPVALARMDFVIAGSARIDTAAADIGWMEAAVLAVELIGTGLVALPGVALDHQHREFLAAGAESSRVECRL